MKYLNDLTPSELDIQIAATGLFDYLRDLLILAGHDIPFHGSYKEARLQFGDKVVELVRAIKANVEVSK